jgi:hypothetical protein
VVLRFDSLRNVSLNQQTNPYFEIVKKEAKFIVLWEKQKTLVPHPDEGSFEKILVASGRQQANRDFPTILLSFL